MKTKLLYISVLLSVAAFGQSPKIDSIRTLIYKYEKTGLTGTIKDTSYIKNLNILARSSVYSSHDTVIKYARKAKTHSQRINYNKGTMVALQSYGMLYTEIGEYEKSKEFLNDALKLAERQHDTIAMMNSYYELGILFQYQAALNISNANCLKLIALGNSSNKSEDVMNLVSMAYECIANNHMMINRYEKALKYYDTVASINQDLGNRISQGQSFSNIAELHLRMKQYPESLDYINRSIGIFEENKENMPDWLAFAYRIKGDIYRAKENYAKALEIYRNAESLQPLFTDNRELAFLKIGLAKASLGLKDYKLAECFVGEALAVGREIKAIEVSRDGAEILYQINQAEGNYESALHYHQEFKKFNDSIYNHTNSKSLAGLEAEVEFIEKENNLILDNEKEHNKRLLLLYLSTGGAAILLTILFLTQRSRKLERKLNSLLAKKNRVLEKRELQLKHTNETKNKLFSIIGHDLRAPINSLNGLIDLLQEKQIEAEDFINFAPQLGEQVKNVSFMLNNLLHWSQQQMRGIKNNPVKNNLFLLANSSVDLLREGASAKNIMICNNIPDDAYIFGDTEIVTILLRNLINNAIKFTPENGRIDINALEKNNNWEIEVKDTGVGMDEMTIQRILSKESYITSSYGTNNEKGTGIGLSLCKEMILKSGGAFHITSIPGHGSSFFFTVLKYQETMQKVG
ncbi:tetratricopeptide repeat-containing sensor histidine kinase [Robertkochia solimangrovi]|uniref:tetratricopeptide repeat-containing sensor histidine kinase n=1 Tax=Robertkochia solimangrovi TaxID=2213046 RepID=UPI00117F8A24|nr:tetratricopeptide repeat-containing sensor histidine kinase [Robertkochia solimangrovi]TRZ43616.1 two-component sensor histidine kinase [Robertkochia solimangrovi]